MNEEYKQLLNMIGNLSRQIVELNKRVTHIESRQSNDTSNSYTKTFETKASLEDALCESDTFNDERMSSIEDALCELSTLEDTTV